MLSIFSKIKTIVGLEIKQNYIRFVEIKRSLLEDQILSYGEMVFENNLFEDNIFIDEKTLINCLKNIKKEVTSKDFNVSLPSNIKLDNFQFIFKEAGIKVSRFVAPDKALQNALIPKDSDMSFLVVNTEKDMVNFLIHDGGEKIFYYEGAPEKHFVASNLNQIYIDWYDEHKEKINNIIFVGSRVEDDTFVEYLGSQTKIPITHANVFVNLKLSENKIPSIPKNECCKYAVAIGLAVS